MKSSDSLLFKLIFSVCLVVPFSIDIFLSGMPAMANYYAGKNISLILSVALFGLAIAQLIYGPLLDRFGRRPVLLAGLWLYTLASAEVMLTHNFTLLVIGRFLQAIGACSATISVFTIARDIYHQEKLLQAMSFLMALMGISPILAPLLGSVLNQYWGWHASFIFLFAMGCFYTIVIQFFLPETQQQKNLNALKLNHIVFNYFSLLSNAKFTLICLVSGLSYSVLFSYFNFSAIVIIKQMHISMIHYGLIIAVNALAIIMMAKVAPKLAEKLTLFKTMQLGILFLLFGGFLMWLINHYMINSLSSFMLPMFLATIGIGLIRPTASTGALQLANIKIAGSATALFNFCAFVAGSLATTLTSQWITQVSAFGLFVALMALLGLILSFMLQSPITCLASVFRYNNIQQVKEL